MANTDTREVDTFRQLDVMLVRTLGVLSVPRDTIPYLVTYLR